MKTENLKWLENVAVLRRLPNGNLFAWKTTRGMILLCEVIANLPADENIRFRRLDTMQVLSMETGEVALLGNEIIRGGRSSFKALPYDETERLRRDPPSLMTLAEAAAWLEISPSTLRSITNQRKITVVKVAGSRRYRLRDLEDYLEANKEAAPQNEEQPITQLRK